MALALTTDKILIATLPTKGYIIIRSTHRGGELMGWKPSSSGSSYPKADGMKEFYSRDTGKIVEYFVNKYGNPTTERPHVHVVHHTSSGEAHIIATDYSGSHVYRKVLRNATGYDVEEEVRIARSYL